MMVILLYQILERDFMDTLILLLFLVISIVVARYVYRKSKGPSCHVSQRCTIPIKAIA